MKAFHDVPQNWFSAYFHHWFGFNHGLFTQAPSKPPARITIFMICLFKNYLFEIKDNLDANIIFHKKS
jgi:hypothetical protein